MTPPTEPASLADELIAALVEVTIRLFEALCAERLGDMEHLVRERQDLIDELGALDAAWSLPADGPQRSGVQEKDKKIKKLFQAGETLIQACGDKRAELSHRRRQHAVARTTARGYRPRRSDTVCTRRYST